MLASYTLASNNFTLINSNTPQDIKDSWENICEKYRTKFYKEFVPEVKIEDWKNKTTLEIVPGKAQGETNYEKPEDGFRIKISGSVDLMQNCILPHEIMHCVFASYVKGHIPRWADEGYASIVEPKRPPYPIKTKWPFKIIMNQKDYPEDVYSYYGQSSNMTEWLVNLKGRIVFRDFINEFCTSDQDWEPLLDKYYGFKTYQEAQRHWEMGGLIINVSK